MLDREWRTLYNKPVDDIREAIREAVQGDDEKALIIGTDSQAFDKRIDFVTVVVIHTVGKGGRAFYTREVNAKFNSLREKLVKEAWLSIQAAFDIEPILPENCDIAALHADVNCDIKKGESARYLNEIAGMIRGQGFKCVTKPNGFAASHIAEHIVKRRNEK